MSKDLREIRLSLPAQKELAPVASLALSGLGMVLGLDVDLLGDLRTVTGECIDCLLHQAGRPESIEWRASVENGWLCLRFTACEREAAQEADTLSNEITRGVLETLMPRVTLDTDELGVYGIECAMPV